MTVAPTGKTAFVTGATGAITQVGDGNGLRRSPDPFPMVEHVSGAGAMAAARDGKEAVQ